MLVSAKVASIEKRYGREAAGGLHKRTFEAGHARRAHRDSLQLDKDPHERY